ncbi:helix-turn-helix transcriptional regulator [Curtobacterium sp. MCPF17_002]|uniref:helix-turn-helix transcriptional regulator n=1 Tax=Curtobacterium sp. MCPF17_002 TaxID=2175645 RepID=UPI0015E8D3A0|nr:helix-turn-helix transcriptional regulator [Curtobacterium sp. MCPF17_002]WIB76650.1 helix-turn-helix transcriptional regulator [Curtobacterium sp. MCPF17_002]
MDTDEPGGPAVVWANWYRFRARERIRHERVMSLCFLWVLGGTGTVRSTGRTFTLEAGSVLRLPWDHDVEYVADDHAPFRLGTVHVVPRHRHGPPVLPLVAHQPGDELYRSPDRSGDRGVPVSSAASSATARRIASLGRYAVERFGETDVEEPVLRSLGALFTAEAAVITAVTTAASTASGTASGTSGVAANGGADGGVPVALEAMTAFVAQHLDRPLSVAEIAAAGDCSPSTAGRLFTAHLGASVSAWVRDARMREAADLLRTTGLRIGEVARAVGFADQLYFSRVFRAAFGVPPSRYGRDVIRP